MIMPISPVSRYEGVLRGNGRIRLFISRLWSLFSLRNKHFFGKIISVILTVAIRKNMYRYVALDNDHGADDGEATEADDSNREK